MLKIVATHRLVVEAIVAMPDQLFYNTGISTYLWIVTNRKERKRKGKIQLIDATSFFKKMRKSLGNKRNEIDEKHRDEVTRLYGEFKQSEFVKIFDNHAPRECMRQNAAHRHRAGRPDRRW